MKKILIIIILIISTTYVNAQVQVGVMMPSVYTIIDTSKYWPSGRLKVKSGHLQRQGFVIYTKESGMLTYKFLDSEKRALDKRYLVSWDDRNSPMLQLRPLWVNPQDFDARSGIKVDSLNLRKRQ